MTEFSKICPKCKRIIYYKRKIYMDKSIKLNSECRSCADKNKSCFTNQKTLFSRICPMCQCLMYYKNKYILETNSRKNSNCKNCADKLLSQKVKGKKRPVFSDEWRKNLSIGHKKSQKWHDSMHTPEYREKHRQKMYRLIDNGNVSVAYNKNTIGVFDYLNQRLNWCGVHAENGGEKIIKHYFLDYYEPNLNLIIEWDEIYHQNKKIMIRDQVKNKKVIEYMNPELYRVDDVTKQVKKIDNLPIDRTQQIQLIINEYYQK